MIGVITREVGLGCMRKVAELARVRKQGKCVPPWSMLQSLPRVPALASLSDGL